MTSSESSDPAVHPSEIYRRRKTNSARFPRDSATVFAAVPVAGSQCHGRIDAEALLRKHGSFIDQTVVLYGEDGFAVMAFDGGRVPLGCVWLKASKGTTSLIIGRHSRCGLQLPADAISSSLRHMAVFVSAQERRPKARMVDLHTKIGFADEAGRVLRSVEIDGSAFFAVGGIALLFLETGRRSVVRKRVFVAEEELGCGSRLDETSVCSKPGPVVTAAGLCGADEVSQGLLVVRSGVEEGRYPVSRSALERGLLIGRYARCDIGLPSTYNALSRVHVLLIRDGRVTLAVDTASTNGMRINGRLVPQAKVSDGTRMLLTDEISASWLTSQIAADR